jgi:hypothetical protein
VCVILGGFSVEWALDQNAEARDIGERLDDVFGGVGVGGDRLYQTVVVTGESFDGDIAR